MTSIIIYNLVKGIWLNYSKFKLLDNIVSFIKASFTHCPACKRRWISHLSLNSISNSSLLNNFYQENPTAKVILPIFTC